MRKIMENKYGAGVDIGGTNTAYGIVNARGDILYRGNIKTKNYPVLNDYVSAVSEGLLTIIDQAGGKKKIKGIGIGAPDGNYFNGCIEYAMNLPWKGIVPLAGL